MGKQSIHKIMDKPTHISFRWEFNQVFAILAYLTLFGYVCYCTATDKKTDTIRDAWLIISNLIIFFFRPASAAPPTNLNSQNIQSVEKMTVNPNNDKIDV